VALGDVVAIGDRQVGEEDVGVLHQLRQRHREQLVGDPAEDRHGLVVWPDVVLLLQVGVPRRPAAGQGQDRQQHHQGQRQAGTQAAAGGGGVPRLFSRLRRGTRGRVCREVEGQGVGRGVQVDAGRGPVDPGVPARLALDHVGEDDRDVVQAAGRMSHLDQRGHHLLGVAVHPLGDVGVGDQAAQPVGTDQEPVARPGVHQFEVGLVLRLAVDHPQDQRAVRVDQGLGLGDPALVDQTLHPGVVPAEAGQLPVAPAVGPRVADVRQAERLPVEHHPADGAAHPVQGRVGVDQLVDLPVGGVDRAGERGEHLVAAAGPVRSPQLLDRHR